MTFGHTDQMTDIHLNEVPLPLAPIVLSKACPPVKKGGFKANNAPYLFLNPYLCINSVQNKAGSASNLFPRSDIDLAVASSVWLAFF
jgi:hypothetical protein